MLSQPRSKCIGKRPESMLCERRVGEYTLPYQPTCLLQKGEMGWGAEVECEGAMRYRGIPLYEYSAMGL